MQGRPSGVRVKINTHKINLWRNNMEENNRKNFLSELIENVKKLLEVEKEIDKELEQARVRQTNTLYFQRQR